MKYDFNKIIDRKGTLSYKWEAMEESFPANPGALPFWIADMDFPCPEPVVRAVQKRAAHPIYGYSKVADDARELIAAWEKKRNHWDAKPEWVQFTNGIVPAISAMIGAFTEPDDGVIIQPPVYYPFTETVRNNGRTLVENPLVFDGNRWNINYEELEQLAAEPKNKLLLLCHPLNPVSRVLDEEELRRVADICLRNGLVLAVDEIHSDLVYRHCTFHSMAALGKEIEQICVIATAPSKTFNIAGLQMSAVFIPNEELRKKFEMETDKRVMYIANLFGAVAFRAAYADPECEEYLEQLIDYLWENYLFLDNYLKTYMPRIKCQRPDATYLLWLDCRELGLSETELEHFCLEEAGVAFDVGKWFGGDGAGFMRINIGCPRSILEQGLELLRAAYQKRGF
ncbi:MAG: pyridoxal phosphate-dependent aminotransferase [Blautia sp.]|nr:pyridoxal phosphate-dependent aminotransferase [Blautia sp.]